MTFSFPNSEKSKFESNKKVCILLKIIQDFSLLLFPSKRKEQYHTKVGSYNPLKYNNTFCIPENYNTNISQQLFDYKITFLNLQHENKNKNSNGDFVLKK